MKPKNLPQSLIKEQAYRIYKRRITQKIEGNSDDDWKAAMMYLEKNNWAFLKWQFKQNLIQLGKFFFIGLPKSDWVKLLAVPFVLSFAGLIITSTLQEKSRQYDLLDRYFKDLENTLLDKNTNKNSKNMDLNSIIVKSKSFAILQSLDVDKKQVIIRFLAESNLLSMKNNGVSLAYLDLKKINLNRLNLQQADLDNTDLSEAYIIRADLSGANLRQANLYKTVLRGSQLKGADLSGANLSESFLGAEDSLLEKTKQANNSGIPLRDYLAQHSNEYLIQYIELNTANLERAILDRTNFSKSNLRGVNFTDVYLREANLQKANLSEAILERANLSKADLSWADLNGANLSGATLVMAILNGANLKEADLSGAYLNGANLKEADLSGAYLNGATLEMAIFNGANLEGADLNGAYLRGATLEMAILNGANLEEANLSGAKDLTLSQVKKAKNWEKAIYDPDFSKQLGLNSAHHPQ
jgi:uncharacterized protein YjbI with pentapeptide repeats